MRIPLSKIEPDLDSGIRGVLQSIRRHDDPLTPQTAARLTKLSLRRINQLCSEGTLEFICLPSRRIYKKSLMQYFLKKHGLDHIDVDLVN